MTASIPRVSTAVTTFITSVALALGPTPATAGDLNAEMNQLFDQLNAVGNYTAPGGFKGQAFNTFTGGSIMARAPSKVYQLAAVQFPSARAGCGGIDVFGGSFSHISAAEFKNMLRNITAALPGIAFQLALESVSPLLGGLTKWAKGLETWINNARINSCETAKALVSTAAEAAGFSSAEACSDLALELGLESDRDAARRRCGTDRAGILGTARSSSDPNLRNKAPFVGNLTWQALRRTGPHLDDAERELIMSMIGTVIFHAEESGRDPEPFAPTIASISQLLYGQEQRRDNVVIQNLLRCDEYVNCNSVRLDTSYVHEPFTLRVERLMLSIANKISTRTPIPNNSQEVGFVNTVSEPVYRMLSIGSSIPGSGLTDTLIGQYRDVIAADFAHLMLERNIRVGMAALEKDYVLAQDQRDRAAQIRQRAQSILLQLSTEKSLLYQKVGSIRAISGHLEQLERQLRSTMPQHLLDMLGQQVAFAGR